MKTTLAALALLLLSLPTQADVFRSGLTMDNFRVIDTTDGDTIQVEFFNCPLIFCKRIGVRLLGIDAPEAMTPKCKAERALAIKAAVFVTDTIVLAEKIELQNVMRDKYFRLAADVIVDGRSLADMLLAQGLAVEYDGLGPRPKWCE